MTEKKTSPVRSKELILACLTSKEEELQQLEKPSLSVVKTACVWLEKKKCADEVAFLQDYARKNWQMEVTATRGRGAPVKGEARIYRVQQIQNSLFIRLPINSLNLGRGDAVKVLFEEDSIKVLPESA